jgi:hypothetical protein
MKKIFLFIINGLCLFASCQEHEELIDISLKIGNLYCSDGSVVNPKSYRESGKTAVAVIFWVNENPEPATDKAFAVSLENLPAVAWAELPENISSVSTSLEALNGTSNTASIIIWGSEEGVSTPAGSDAYNYAKQGVFGWFLPSMAEAMHIYRNKDAIYDAFKYCDGKEFSNIWYWTSTQDGTGPDTSILNALSVSLTEGRGTGSNKMNIFAVRPVIGIK